MGENTPPELTAGGADDSPDRVLASMPDRWEGVIAVEGVVGADGRMIAGHGLRLPPHRALAEPRPLLKPGPSLYSRAAGVGQVGTVEELWRVERRGPHDEATGVFDIWAAGTIRRYVLPVGRVAQVELDLSSADLHTRVDQASLEAVTAGGAPHVDEVWLTVLSAEVGAVTIGNRPLWPGCTIRRTEWAI